MKLNVSIREVNADHGQKPINQSNMKYNWSESFEVIDDIDKKTIKEGENVIYVDSEKDIDLLLENVTVLSCYKEGELITRYMISDELIESIREVYKEKTNVNHFYFYLKENKKFTQIGKHNYILKENIKELV